MTESIFTTKGAAFASHTHKKIQFVPVHSIYALPYALCPENSTLLSLSQSIRLHFEYFICGHPIICIANV